MPTLQEIAASASMPRRSTLGTVMEGARGGELRAYEPGVMDNVRNFAMNALAPLFGGDVRAAGDYLSNRTSIPYNQVAPAIEALTPVGDIQEGIEAKKQYDQGNYLSATGHGLLASLGALGPIGDFAAPLGKAIFAGVGAATANKQMLKRAEEMLASGASRDEIWNNTGWFQGADGKWRFEIDDSESVYKPNQLKDYEHQGRPYKAGELGWAVTHPELFAAYPDLSTIERIDYSFSHPEGVFGQYRPADDFMPESITSWKEGGASTNLHEIQHAIQKREGFASGANPKFAQEFAPENPKWRVHMENKPKVERALAYSKTENYQRDLEKSNALWEEKYEPLLTKLDDDRVAAGRGGITDIESRVDEIFSAFKEEQKRLLPNFVYVDEVAQKYGLKEPQRRVGAVEAYRRAAGEVEARNVQKRRNMGADERKANPPWITQDTPDESQLLLDIHGGGLLGRNK
jgi:hypothetical protein